LKVVGLFAGIGGLELGLRTAGHHVHALADNDPFACSVLASRLHDVPNLGDVAAIANLPVCDLVTCGFPCQDLSPAGNGAGIHGAKSRLVREVLRLLDATKRKPAWLLLENVPFMLSLKRGAGMSYLTTELESRGYRWAYRVIDSRAFGLAQRRRRLFILASRSDDPATLLFKDEGAARQPDQGPGTLYGFYWTEGNRGVGWAVDATPPLKGTSGVAIVSPPGIWRPQTRDFVTPTIQDAEALQGFKRNWTSAAREQPNGERARWRLVGNAVSVPVAGWFGRLLKDMQAGDLPAAVRLPVGHRWPNAGFGASGRRYMVETSEWPGRKHYVGLNSFLSMNAPLLSRRAAAGFLSRLEKSTLRVPQDFLHDLRAFVGEGVEDGPRHQQAHGPHARARQPSRKGAPVGTLS
jgi:DNA (cytosine-5)-methyltransferase 1